MNKVGITSEGLIGLLFPKKDKKPEYESPVIKITGEVYKKINLYAKIVSEIVGENIECGGMMLNYRGRNDGVIRDTYLNYQIVNSHKTHYLDYELPTYTNYVQKSGMSWSGIWHSHGDGIACHSPGDNKCIKGLHAYNKNKNENVVKNKKYNLSKKITSDEVFYSPSLVINKEEYINGFNGRPGRNYYAEFLVSTGKGRDVKVKNAKLEVIEENNNIIPSLEEMVLEVGEKVKYKRLVLGRIAWGKKLKNFPNYNGVLEKYKKINHVQEGQKNVTKQYSLNPERRMILPKEILNCIIIREARK